MQQYPSTMAHTYEFACAYRLSPDEGVATFDTPPQNRGRLSTRVVTQNVVEERQDREMFPFSHKSETIAVLYVSELEFREYEDPQYAGWTSFSPTHISAPPYPRLQYVVIKCSPKPQGNAVRMTGEVKPAGSSASKLQSNEHLSLYPLPAAPTCFFPSQRLRSLEKAATTLLDSLDPETRKNLARVQRDLECAASKRSATTYCHPSRPEEDYTRKVYNALIQVFATLVGGEVRDDIYDTAHRERICLGATLTKPEPRAVLLFEFFLIPAFSGEAKGVDGSIYTAYAQCFQTVADGAMFLLNDGLPLKDCVVPGLMIADDNCVQLCACFLAEPCFPCFVLLTNPINLHTTSGRRLLAAWFLALADFTDETKRLCSESHVTLSPMKNQVRLDLSEKAFITPVSPFGETSSSPMSTPNYPHRPYYIRLLETYKLLHSDDVCREIVLFPFGWGQVPLKAEHPVVFDEIQTKWKQQFIANLVGYTMSENPLSERQIFLLFSNLKNDDGWQMSSSVFRPTLRNLVEAKLKSIVPRLARVVTHLDLRGANVMVRFTQNNSEVEVRVIDWEYAIRHGEAVPQAILDLNLATLTGLSTSTPMQDLIIFDEESSLAWMLSCVTEEFRAHKADRDEVCRAAVSALEDLAKLPSNDGEAIKAVATSYSTLPADDEEALEEWMKRAVAALPIEDSLSTLSVNENAVLNPLGALRAYC